MIWGLSFWTFVAFLVGAYAALLGAGAAAERTARRGRPPSRDPHPYELAYLEGGGRHAITASLVALRLDGAVDAYATGQPVVAGPPRSATTPLDLAVHHAISGRRTRNLAALASDPGVRAAIKQLRTGLAAQGLVMGDGARPVARLAPWPARGLLALCFFTGWDALSDGDAPWYQHMLLVVLCVVLAVVSTAVGRGNERTRAGERALEDARVRHAHLDPEAAPVYDGATALPAVALFGTPALMAIDPMFSQTVGLGRFLALSGSSTASGSGGSAGSSSTVCSSDASVCSSGGCGGGGSCGGGGGGGGGCGGGGGGGCGGGGGGGG
ncbi:TIGR04222 domain-containing membrane protein [Spirillospora sp. CA-255316]